MSETAFRRLLEVVRPEVELRLRDRWARELGRLRGHGPDVAAMAGAARDLTMRGGKRFRAALVLASFRGVAPKADPAPAFEAGTALELLQSYLLIQDDWIDGDLVRRGGPSVHAALSRAFGGRHVGAAAAVLASDLTWGLALDVLASAPAPRDRVLDALRLILRVHADVVVGQELDLLGRAPDVEAMHALKTGSYTVHGPLALGATLAGAPAATLAALSRYAAPLGVAFQLRDDLMGTFATPEETGKPSAGDLRAGKRTALLAVADERLGPSGRAALARVLGRPRASEAAIRAAVRALSTCGARAEVERRLSALCDRAEALSAELPLTASARAELAGAAAALRWPPAPPAEARARGARRTARAAPKKSRGSSGA